jgi:hypothetical protein
MRALATIWRGVQHLQTAYWFAGAVIGAVLLVGSVLAPILSMSVELASVWILVISASVSLLAFGAAVYAIGRRRPDFHVELVHPPLDDLDKPIRLQLINDGPTAEFEAQVFVLNGDDGHHQPPWHLRWQGWDEPRKEVLTGDRYIIELARWHPDTAQSTGSWRPGFLLTTTAGDLHIAPDQHELHWCDDLYKQRITCTVKVSSVQPVSHAFIPVSLRLAPYGYHAQIKNDAALSSPTFATRV